MIDLSEATLSARRYVQEMTQACGIRLQLFEGQTIERSFGWVFFYDAVPQSETRDVNAILAGNAPFIIDRRDGTLHETGTAYSIMEYLDAYERTGKAQPE